MWRRGRRRRRRCVHEREEVDPARTCTRWWRRLLQETDRGEETEVCLQERWRLSRETFFFFFFAFGKWSKVLLCTLKFKRREKKVDAGYFQYCYSQSCTSPSCTFFNTQNHILICPQSVTDGKKNNTDFFIRADFKSKSQHGVVAFALKPLSLLFNTTHTVNNSLPPSRCSLSFVAFLHKCTIAREQKRNASPFSSGPAFTSDARILPRGAFSSNSQHTAGGLSNVKERRLHFLSEHSPDFISLQTP